MTDHIHLGGDIWAHPGVLHPTLTDPQTLTPHPNNPNNGDTDAIAESLVTNAMYRPIMAQRSTGHIIAGNHTYAASIENGATQVPVIWLDVDDAEAVRIMLADNRTAELGRYDDALLLQLLEPLKDGAGLVGTGWTPTSVADLEAAIRANERRPLSDPDEVPPLPESSPVTQLGDVWVLGPHRVVCGDATDVTAYDALLAGDLADLVWTDPPYGVDYVGKTKDALTLENDVSAGLEEFLRAALGATFKACRPGAAWYVACADKAGSFMPFLTVLSEMGVYRHQIVWVKDSFVLGRGDYHFRHEPVLYGWHPGAARLHPVADRTQDTVWEIARPKASKQHPTMKPVALIKRALENSTNPAALVLDPFGGSGSTLIACHTSGRVARLIELDPRYVDVICRRYQQATGTLPVRDGTPHDFVNTDAQ